MNKLFLPALITALLPFALLPGHLQAQPVDLEILVDSIAAQHVGSGIAGLSVGVTRGDEVLLKKSYGFASLPWQVAMPMDAVHEIGSVTKQFTTAAVLQLYGQGKLDLDADLTVYLPGFDTQGRQITVRRLMDHTSGIKGFTEMPQFGEISQRKLPRDSLLRLIEQQPYEFEPGEAMIYNNSAYFLLGLIIETVSGQSYAQYVQENLFDVAGMPDSSYCSNETIVRNRAEGYQYTPDGFALARYHDHTWPYAAGSLCSTVSDLLRWNQALHHGEILAPDLYALLITPAPLNDGTAVRYAMGLVHYQHPTGRVIEHGGGIDGFLSHSRYYPDEDVTVVVLQNTGGPPGPAAIADQIGAALFGTRELIQPQPLPDDLSAYTGTFRGPARGAVFTVTTAVADGQLTFVLQVGDNGRPAEPLAFIGNDTFARGDSRYLFDTRNGEPILRIDSPASHYVLRAVDE